VLCFNGFQPAVIPGNSVLEKRLKSSLFDNFSKIWARCEKRFMPDTVWTSDPLTFWRERILFVICFTAGVLGPLALIPSLTLAFHEGLWTVFFLDIAAYLAVLAILLSRRLSFPVRAWAICLMLYSLGVGLMFMLGPEGAGYIWLFGASVIMAAILGFSAALWSLALNLLTLMAVGLYIGYGSPAWSLLMENPLEKWGVMTVNFLLINTLVTLTTAMMLNDLKRALVNEQKTSASLRESEARYRTLAMNFPNGALFLVDRDFQILAADGLELQKHGLSRDALVGRPIRKVLPEIADIIESECRQVFEGKTSNFEFDYGQQTFMNQAIPITGRDGRIDYGLIITQDVTRQRSQAEQLRRAQKMEALGLLAGGVAHDLNNVLSGIVSYPELLLLDLPEDSPLRNPVLTIQRSGHRAADIVQDLLTLARRGVISTEVLNLNRMVSEYLNSPELKKLIHHHPTVQIATRLQDDLLNVVCSPTHLKKTIMNLVSNAAEAQPDGGNIFIATQNRYVDRWIEGYDDVKEGDYAVLIVEDRGIGIGPDDLKRIFEPFYTKKVMGRSGTGLGMAVVWATVQDHQGYIDVKSVEGEGTTFELYFPATRQMLAADKAPVPIEHYTGNGESILVVDDVKAQRMIASGILERLNYRLASVSSGEAAEAYLQTRPVDLVLLDMVMEPGMDGLDTYRRILDLHPGQKAIIASGFSETERVKAAIDLGARQYIKKPYTIEKIGLAVKRALQG
jgi:PAS domain S-box-containing protein